LPGDIRDVFGTAKHDDDFRVLRQIAKGFVDRMAQDLLLPGVDRKDRISFPEEIFENMMTGPARIG
jgi:hypothetical protein